MEKFSAAVIGGGAAGIVAAINLGRRGASVVICEKMPRLGKKILATGNGRCNLLNDNLDESFYNPAAGNLVKSVFERFGKTAILDFFKSLGLQAYSQDGRIFPVTNQAASVFRVLEMELQRLAIPLELDFNCSGISSSPNGLVVSSVDGRKIECRRVIITGGGKTYPAYGSDGSLYKVAAGFGHSLVEPVPAAVPLVIKDHLCQVLQGQRIAAGVRSLIAGCRGEEFRGELLFTQYGLSGTAILDVSEEISVAMNRRGLTEVYLIVDMVPFMDRRQLGAELEKRKREKWPVEDMLAGILPNKFGAALKYLFEKNEINAIIDLLKGWRFKVGGTRGWNEAEFTCGGINVNEVDSATLESKLKRGVYFAGEILDVNGRRGGYNLAWAWASGWLAGKGENHV
jgi:predicted Rossmann fold flavoprotein